ncbi:hypothetical protein CEXT_503041 [Caerostris extrusa]|uniref:Uncharacterized protein n=1 Tax=Caerostris extrusa TaxID=172846 RepID=A0AAV4PDZ3_CAEEX|nr:hypothetical protein CEXT_503041 [Caerostris extrusa]
MSCTKAVECDTWRKGTTATNTAHHMTRQREDLSSNKTSLKVERAAREDYTSMCCSRALSCNLRYVTSSCVQDIVQNVSPPRTDAFLFLIQKYIVFLCTDVTEFPLGYAERLNIIQLRESLYVLKLQWFEINY